MNIRESISPSVFKNMIIVIGLFVVFSVWQSVSKRVADLRYERIYGESFSDNSKADNIDLKSLPIVVARSTAKASSRKTINEQAIEDAFKVPEFVPVIEDGEDEALEAPKATIAEQLFLTYRPAVSAIGRQGAVINGVFWRTGEKIDSMAVRLESGETVNPFISKVLRDQVVLKVDGEVLTLPFERF